MNSIDMKRREFLQVASVLGVGAAFGGYSIAVNAAGERVLTARTDLALASLDPGYMVGGSEITVQWALMPRLANFAFKDGALTWEPSDFVDHLGQRDPTHIDFTVKQGLQWSNGFGEFTAEDVKYSYERMLVSEWKGNWSALDRVDLKDRYSGTLVLKKPFTPLWTITLIGGTGTLVCKAATEKVGGRYTTEIPAALGPYKIREWVPKQKLVLEPNPQWSGPKPWFERINYLVIAAPEAAELAYEAGEVDCTKVTAKTQVRWQKKPPANTRLHVAGALQYMWMGMNTDHPKLQDIRVRKAIQHAVDVDSIIQGAYEGASIRSYGMVCPGLVGQRKSNGIDYDPAKARALLSEAGVSGLSLELKTLNHQERVLAAQIIQANLGAVGIQVKVLPLDSGPFWSMGQESKGGEWKDLQVWLMRFGGNPDPHSMAQWFVGDQVGVWNWERWRSAEYDELFEKGQLESDPEKRHAIYVRMQEIMDETGAYVWIGHEPEVFAHRTSVVPMISAGGEEDFARFKA